MPSRRGTVRIRPASPGGVSRRAPVSAPSTLGTGLGASGSVTSGSDTFGIRSLGIRGIHLIIKGAVTRITAPVLRLAVGLPTSGAPPAASGEGMFGGGRRGQTTTEVSYRGALGRRLASLVLRRPFALVSAHGGVALPSPA